MYFHSRKLSCFTNVEMLIVFVMVIGLAALSISTFQKNSFIPKDDLRKKDAREFARSLEDYKNSSGSFFDPYPAESCLGNNSYKVISTRNMAFRDVVNPFVDIATLNLPKENFFYVVNCSLDDFAIVATLNASTEDVTAKSFLKDFLATLPQSKIQNTFIVTQ